MVRFNSIDFTLLFLFLTVFYYFSLLLLSVFIGIVGEKCSIVREVTHKRVQKENWWLFLLLLFLL